MTAADGFGTVPRMTIEPRPRQVLPASPEQRAETAAVVQQFRADADARRAQERPLREAMIAVLAEFGLTVADEAAALDCPCACHPRIDVSAHGGGGQAGCGCQQTPEDRRARLQAAFAALRELSAELADDADDERAAVAARAEELQVSARVVVDGAPFVLAGVVDGRGFYLRERHDAYRVTVSADEDPGSDPWAADASVLTLDIADGDAVSLRAEGRFSAVRALDVAVAAVRSFLRQSGCTHARAGAGDRFCAACGAALIAPELP